jgi:hypothetical protein
MGGGGVVFSSIYVQTPADLYKTFLSPVVAFLKRKLKLLKTPKLEKGLIFIKDYIIVQK